MTATEKPLPTTGYGCFVLYNVSSSGGHINDAAKDGSCCGIEKRFPYNETAVEQEDAKFPQWYKTNEQWICRSCLRIFKKAQGT